MSSLWYVRLRWPSTVFSVTKSACAMSRLLSPSAAISGHAALAGGERRDERLLLQAVVPDRLTGRIFAVKDTAQCWAFLPGLVGASLLIPLLGTRTVFLLAGAGVLAVWCLTWLALRDTWSEHTRAVHGYALRRTDAQTAGDVVSACA